jgi:hypothetical protein
MESIGMTKHDMLIDSINIKLYEVFNMGRTLDDSDWDEDAASQISQHILELVEEFQATRRTTSYGQWRATD